MDPSFRWDDGEEEQRPRLWDFTQTSNSPQTFHTKALQASPVFNPGQKP
ncbi:hypothetical protein J2W94_002603 [Pseudoxanthomonas sacheonensis]|uniref:Uncharacterized protein n=1 Tax=Pseudoxanthomonas sacheonensis TaxID=443615 RepID=A0ABU1RU56_9GAMM|nr:hypothetical protein [Pseudoxanthomonas sacheonensis]